MLFREFQEYLIFIVFLASGISFMSGALSEVIVRIAVAAVGVAAALILAAAIAIAFGFSNGFDALSSGPDALRLLGSLMLVFYFGACAVSCLPHLRIRSLRAWGLVWHFLYMPLAIFLTTFSAMGLPAGIRSAIFANALLVGLVYAMLWYRMIDLHRASQARSE